MRDTAPTPTMPLIAALAGACAVIGVVMFVASATPAAGVAFLVAAACVALLPVVQRRRAQRVATVARGGRSATAHIVHVHELRSRGGLRRVRIQYVVTPETGASYRLTTRHALPAGLEHRFVAGGVLAVRVDPADPKNVVFVGEG
jgi:hypothetical protein